MPPPPLKFDFHLHTLDDPYDHHVYHTAFELIDKAAALGYGALAITLHGFQYRNPEVESYARDRGILLLPGVEQNIGGCHVLLINFDREQAHGIATFADLARARTPENLVIAAHPYYPNSTCLKDKLLEHRELFDAVEISGYYHRLWNPNLKAMAAARELGLPLVGNSDTHTLEQFGTTWSEIACEMDIPELIRGIKAGRAEVKSRSLALGEMGVITWKVVARGYMKWIDYKKERGYQGASESRVNSR
jgi:predicted metal-dependent phosphoesterase TrpH